MTYYEWLTAVETEWGEPLAVRVTNQLYRRARVAYDAGMTPREFVVDIARKP